MKITLDQFKQILSSNRNAGEWYEVAVELFDKYDINTPNRIAGFMAQTGHESVDYKRKEENLNYSAERLMQVFGKRYFKTISKAREYERNPEKLANYVYMDKNRSKRGALGNIHEGDGWKFRGRGVKQLTGRNNYTAFGRTIGLSADEVADYIDTKKGSLETALWFWKENNLERYADNNDIVGMSKRVNGGTIGLSDRTSRYEKAKNVLSGSRTSAKSQNSTTTLMRGSKGPEVEKLQRALGVNVDGIFGIGTSAALKNFQRKNGLAVDGVAGPSTLSKLYK